MITRIEIDGFKSFLDFKLDVPPFLALVGPNASGKSNLFDALRLVAGVVESGPDSALTEQERGTAKDLFHRSAEDQVVDRLRIVVDMIVSSPGGPLAMRCEVRLGLSDDRPYVEGCSAWVSSPEEHDRLHHVGASADVRSALVRARAQFYKTGARDRIRLTGRSQATWGDVSRYTWDELEARENLRSEQLIWRLLAYECRGWRLLALDPTVMRGKAPAPDDRPLNPWGANLAAVLYRLAERDVLWQVEADLAAIIPGPVEIVPLFFGRDQEYDFDVVFANTGKVPPRLLSDGTLRALALCASAHDLEHPGMQLIEEVENGLHPARVAELVRRLTRGLPDLGADELAMPLRQVIVTTHSPALVSMLWPDRAGSLVFTETVTHIDGPKHRRSHVTRALPVAEEGEPGTYASPWDVERFLSTVQEVAP